MPTEAFDRRALSEALRDAIAGRSVTAAVFTTYSFDPGFFDLHVLPLLFARGFSKQEAVRQVELDEELRNAAVAVYFDRGAVNAGRRGGCLGVQAFGMRRATAGGATKGCFHPKLTVVLLSDEDQNQSLVTCVSSANLTEAGQWTNVECAWIDCVPAGANCSYSQDLLGILDTIRREASRFEADHDALTQIRKFANGLQQSKRRTADGYFNTRLFFGQQPFGDFLRDELRLPPQTYHLEVISPFFDPAGTALDDVQKLIKPKSTLVYLPKGDDGAATVSAECFAKIGGLDATAWADFVDPAYVARAKKTADDLPRTVHAKVYRLWSRSPDESREFVVLGSVNLTQAAHSARQSGNLEVGVVLEGRSPVLRPFLRPIEKAPAEFDAATDAHDEEPKNREPCPLLLRYHWSSKRLEGHWDESQESPPMALRISGVALSTQLGPLPPQQWTTLPQSLSVELEPHLVRTSLVEVLVPDAEPSWIVVHETELVGRPPVLMHLTVEEILRYWSALSDAQRQAVLERADVRRARGLARDPGLGLTDGMFDRFAGVFHAFERLREHVEKSVEENRLRDAEYRLFGAKHDSLPTLIDRVLTDDEQSQDDVEPTTRLAVRYVTVLSAARLLRQLESSVGGFLDDHPEDMKRLRSRLEDIETLRGAVASGCGEAGEAFVRWFDEWFIGTRDRVEQ